MADEVGQEPEKRQSEGQPADGAKARPVDPEREAKIAAAKAMAAKVAAARAAAAGNGPAPASGEKVPAAGGAAKERPVDPEREAKIAAAKAMAAKVAAARAGGQAAGGGAAPAAPAKPAAPAQDPREKMARVATAAATKDAKTVGAPMTRRTMLCWLMWGSVVALFGETAGGSLAMFWPNHVTGFGGVVQAGPIGQFSEVNGGPWTIGEAHAYLVHPQPGLLALWWRCVHLGCTVPWRPDEGIFHCPCHGSEYTYTGDRTAGPAPRSLDLFPIMIDSSGKVFIDTSSDKVMQRLHYNPN